MTLCITLGHLAPESGDGARKHQVERELGNLQGAGSTPNPGSGGVHAVELPLQGRLQQFYGLYHSFTLILMAEPDVLQVYSTAIMVV
jgi:hypothetical protein